MRARGLYPSRVERKARLDERDAKKHLFERFVATMLRGILYRKLTLSIRLGALLYKVHRVLRELLQGRNQHLVHVRHG